MTDKEVESVIGRLIDEDNTFLFIANFGEANSFAIEGTGEKITQMFLTLFHENEQLCVLLMGTLAFHLLDPNTDLAPLLEIIQGLHGILGDLLKSQSFINKFTDQL